MSLRDVRILRFAFGTGLSVALAYGLEYPVSFLSTVLAAAFLGTPAPSPGARALATIEASIAASFAVGIVMSLVLVPSPLVYFLALSLLLFRIFHASMGGASPFIVLMALIGVILIPVLGTQSTTLAVDVAADFFWAATIGFAWVAIAHAVLPDPGFTSASPAPADPTILPDEERYRAALAMVALVLPLAMAIVLLQWSDQITTLLYVAILSMRPTALRAGAGMVVGSLIGGSAALVVYVLTSIHHSWLFLVLLVLWILLMLGRRIFSEGPRAALFAGAPAAFLILISSTNSAFGEETETKLLMRLISIVLATSYLVIGQRLLSSLATWRGRRQSEEASA